MWGVFLWWFQPQLCGCAAEHFRSEPPDSPGRAVPALQQQQLGSSCIVYLRGASWEPFFSSLVFRSIRRAITGWVCARVAARVEGCGSTAEGKFHGSVSHKIKKPSYMYVIILYIYIYNTVLYIHVHTQKKEVRHLAYKLKDWHWSLPQDRKASSTPRSVVIFVWENQINRSGVEASCNCFLQRTLGRSPSMS